MNPRMTPAIRDVIRAKLREDIKRNHLPQDIADRFSDDRSIDMLMAKAPPELWERFERIAETNEFMRSILPEDESFHVGFDGANSLRLNQFTGFVVRINSNLHDWFCAEHFDRLKEILSSQVGYDAISVELEALEDHA